MNRRRLMLKAGTVASASLLSGCSKHIKSSPTKPRELRADTSHPIIDDKPKLQNGWSSYTLLIDNRKDIERVEEDISRAISDWQPIEFPEQVISVVSVVVPVKSTLKPEKIELEGNKFRYDFHVEENKSTDPDLPDPYLFNIVNLWNLNGYSVPTGITVHINGKDNQ